MAVKVIFCRIGQGVTNANGNVPVTLAPQSAVVDVKAEVGIVVPNACDAA